MDIRNIPNKLFSAAANQTDDGGSSASLAVQSLFQQAWSTMTIGQKLGLLGSGAVSDLVGASRAAFTSSDLVNEVREQVAQMEAEVAVAGYAFLENDWGHFWETADDSSGVYERREDAVEAAHKHLRAQNKVS